VVVDLAAVVFSGSPSPTFLAHLYQAAPTGSVLLICRPTSMVRTVLRLTNMAQIAAIRDEACVTRPYVTAQTPFGFAPDRPAVPLGRTADVTSSPRLVERCGTGRLHQRMLAVASSPDPAICTTCGAGAGSTEPPPHCTGFDSSGSAGLSRIAAGSKISTRLAVSDRPNFAYGGRPDSRGLTSRLAPTRLLSWRRPPVISQGVRHEFIHVDAGGGFRATLFPAPAIGD
jgi:hypothetical protein